MLPLHPVDEIAVDLQADFTALLRVELDRDQIIADYHTAKWDAVVCRSRDNIGVYWVGIITVDEIEVRAIRYIYQSRVALPIPVTELYTVPSHVRHLDR